tara:strand:- start:127 stop:408 length:282 start_codon:yes stop_codon:yes gene_type:complete
LGSNNKASLLCHVFGKVQGVYYRATIRDYALSLQIDGWAKNLKNGSVEIVVAGEHQSVDKILALLWEGSKDSKVLSISINKWNDKVKEGFFIE